MTSSSIISDVDLYLFGQGTHYEIYEKLGCHPACINGVNGYTFAVWAPHAKAVSVAGTFNDWSETAAPMKKLSDGGVYYAFLPEVQEGDLYKYAITTAKDEIILKADPYAFSAELRPGTASRVCNLTYQFSDQEWLEQRSKAARHPAARPLSIYEVQLPSWRRHPGEDGFYNYREAAESLAEYVKSMGYTHIELIGVSEHPLDASWGYQVTNYYAPTARHGDPNDFMYFVDYMHKEGIGVILDWVPAHFPKDAFALADFDGQALYEYPDPRLGEHPDWGTKIFNYGLNEVSNFLIANALFWVEKYHLDGLRVDAVASMLYLNYGKKDGEWVPNIYGGHENLDAIEFFRHLNSVMAKRNPGAMTIAEESTAWPGVTAAPKNGGLGFTFKWNMGWMHDFLEYMKQDPLFRKFNHNKMTFGLTYAYSENFILVLSHDEVVHLKRSMLEKMPGTDEEKFASLKAGYAFMMGHPGKKLLFMGQEFGQRREWSEEREIDWFLLDKPEHRDLQHFYSGLLQLYKKHPALYQLDDSYEGFRWVNCEDGDRSIFSFVRYSRKQKETLLFVVNFTPVARPDYRVGVPKAGKWELLLDETVGLYGKGRKKRIFTSRHASCDTCSDSIAYPLPAYGIAIFKYQK